jgi:hypothetical protein
VRYTVSGLSGNINIKSTRQVYVSANFGTNGAATYGGYYQDLIQNQRLLIVYMFPISNASLMLSKSKFNHLMIVLNGISITWQYPIQTPIYTPTRLLSGMRYFGM